MKLHDRAYSIWHREPPPVELGAVSSSEPNVLRVKTIFMGVKIFFTIRMVKKTAAAANADGNQNGNEVADTDSAFQKYQASAPFMSKP